MVLAAAKNTSRDDALCYWFDGGWQTGISVVVRGRGVDRRSVSSGGQAKDFSVEERLAMRRAESAPVLAKLRERLLEWKEQLLPKHPMAEAVNYALGQWPELNVFCSDGAVPMDNNVSEREMKRIVLNRKNSLFVGNSRGGRTAAILASLTSTCRRLEVDPQMYLTQLLMNLAPGENERVIRLAARPMEDPSPGSNRNLHRSVCQ